MRRYWYSKYVIHTFASIIVFFQKKRRYVTHQGGGGGPPICYGLLHGGGGVQKWPKSCYVICEWPQTALGSRFSNRFPSFLIVDFSYLNVRSHDNASLRSRMQVF